MRMQLRRQKMDKMDIKMDTRNSKVDICNVHLGVLIPLIIRLSVFQMSTLEHLRMDILRFLNHCQDGHVAVVCMST